MAKLTISLDTETQTMSVDVDGQTVENVNEVNVANWGNTDDPAFSFYVQTYEKLGTVHRMTRLMAKENPEAEEAKLMGTARSVANFPNLVAVPDKSKAMRQIEDWFRKNRK